MSLTLPQIIMLNYESWRSYKEVEMSCDAKRQWEKTKDKTLESDPSIAEFGGERLSEIEKDPDKLNAYLSDWSAFG